jgi:hypothetical protein
MRRISPTIPLAVLVVAVTIAAVGCKKSSKHSPPVVPVAAALSIDDQNIPVRLENVPFTVTIRTLDTSGHPAAYSGSATISTVDNGFVTPTTVALSGTATSLTLNYRLSGDNHILLRAAGLSSAFNSVYIQSELPPVGTGPLAEGAVLIGSGVAATWDSAGVWSPSVVPATTMTMYYAGNRTGIPSAIGMATSTDGLHWTRVGVAPVVGPGATANTCDPSGADRPMVIPKSGAAGFLMFYRGRNGAHVHVCLAESPDGSVWTPFAGPAEDGSVLASEAPGSFDSLSIDGLAPFADGTGYGGLYSFHGSYLFGGLTSASGFAFTTSPDGHVWTRHNAATFSSALEISFADQPAGDSWDANGVGALTVFPEQSAYRIWAGGTATHDAIGYYTAYDFSFIGGSIDNENSFADEVIGTGGTGSFNAHAAREPDITVGPDGKRWLYFTGIDAAGRSSIGVARFSQ